MTTHDSASALNTEHPISLRIAGAGARRLDDAQPAVRTRLDTVMATLAAALPAAHATEESPALRQPAHLTLLTGLADGADQCMAAALLNAPAQDAITREHVAVLPFETSVYRDRSTIDDKATFDSLLARSSTVIELDGRWLADDAPGLRPGFSGQVRTRGYQAMARLILARADLLLAVLDPLAKGSPGGTLETVHVALANKLPVLLLAFGESAMPPRLHLLRAESDWEALLVGQADRTLITPETQHAAFATLLKELAPAPLVLPDEPRPLWIESVWPWFQNRFRHDTLAAPQAPTPSLARPEAPAMPEAFFERLRSPVSRLNRHFSGRYRGGYLANYLAAAMATTLAAASLALMVFGYKLWAEHHKLPCWLIVVLVMLATCKLGLVKHISWTTRRAHGQAWNAWAVRTRYLAEHWRLLLWLPALGVLRSPRRSGEHHADEHFGQGSADALLRASLRDAPASTGLHPHPTQPLPYQRLDLPRAIAQLQHEWIVPQHGYHLKTQATMATMAHQLGEWVERMNTVVIACVSVDIALLLWSLANDRLPPPLQLPGWLEVVKVLLVMTAATLPAWVAAQNGIRAQTEARRLSERSKQIAATLGSLDEAAAQLLARMQEKAGQAEDPGSWTLDALELAERCSKLVAEDVAEWSVLYSNEMPDT